MVCGYSGKTNLRRGEAITCWNKEKRDLEKSSIFSPCYCVATKLGSYTRHNNPDVDIDLNEMNSCPYRKKDISEKERIEIEEAKKEDSKLVTEIAHGIASMTPAEIYADY